MRTTTELSLSLRTAIAGCEACRSDGTTPVDRSRLCESHRTLANTEICADRAALESGPDESLSDLMQRAMTSGSHGTELLSSFRRQARALEAVWEAYRRGAAHIPDSVASEVERAIVRVPRIIGGTA